MPIVTDSRGQEMGYRPLEIDDVELEQICTDIDTAETDRERLKHFKPLQDIARRVQVNFKKKLKNQNLIHFLKVSQ